MKPQQTFSGFTLVEVLVVLVLVSLVSLLLTQGLVQTLDLRERVLQHVETGREAALREQWFRQSVGSIVADLEDRDRGFRGRANGFRAISLAAPHLEYGIPALIHWELEEHQGGHRLRYRTETPSLQDDDDSSRPTQWPVLHWQGPAGHFDYLGHDGEWHDQWPPALDRETHQLPAAIRFQGHQRGAELLWLVALPARKDPRPGLQLPEDFL